MAMEISTFWITVIALIFVGLTVLTVLLTLKAHKNNLGVGEEAFNGKVGTAKTDINPRGKFYVYGEYWDARVLGEPLYEGDKGRVVDIKSTDEKFLIVEKIKDD